MQNDSRTIAEVVRDNLNVAMSYHGWHNRDVIARCPEPVPDSTFNYWKVNGTTNIAAIEIIANALGWTKEELLEQVLCEELEEMKAHRIWNPTTGKESMAFADKLREHAPRAKRLVSLMQEVPCSWMSEETIDKMYTSYFQPVEEPTYGKSLKREYKKFGQEQRKRFEQGSGPLPYEWIAIIPRRDFEKMVKRQRPFDRCTAEDIRFCLLKVRDECIRKRGVAFVLIDTASVVGMPDVRDAYGEVDSVVTVGDTFTFRREMVTVNDESYPRILRWSEESDEIAKAAALLTTYVPAGTDMQKLRDTAIAEIDNYLQLLA